MCYGNKKFTLCFAGDAAAEEDYFLLLLAGRQPSNSRFGLLSRIIICLYLRKKNS